MKTVAQTFILTILTVFGLTSCDNTKQTTTEQPSTTADTTLKVTTNQEIKAIANQEIRQDTIQYDDLLYPYDTQYIAKLLTTGTFQSNEVWENADKEKWFGLFQNNLGYYLAETKIKTTRVHDDMDEKESDKTAWLVQTINNDNSIILIAKLDFLSNRKIQQIDLSKYQIFPDDTLKFNYLGIDYKIYATGSKVINRDTSEWSVVNYKLYFTANKNGQVITELLFARPLDVGVIPTIFFAGDIDGDGILDLLIDTASSYMSSAETLYLSKPADKGHLLKAVGIHEISIIGC